MTTTLDPLYYRDILVRLADKVRRNGGYYRRMALGMRRKSDSINRDNPDESRVLIARADSLERCAKDMDFTFDRAVERLPKEDVDAILNLHEGQAEASS